MIKVLKKLGKEVCYIKIIKAKYDRPISNIVLYEEKQKTFPLISEMRKGCPPLLFN
jgi:hypothetical protein